MTAARARSALRRNALAIALVATSLALAAPAAAQTTIYKWRDRNGVVHYSNSPPPEGTKATVLDESKSKISVVPAFQAPEPAPPADAQLQSRVQRLERELEDERRSQAAASQAQTESYQRWREECLKQRRLDCDDPAAAPSPVYGYPVPPVVRPPITRPAKPAPSPAPPGYTVGPGPGGIGGQYVPTPPRLRQPAEETAEEKARPR